MFNDFENGNNSLNSNSFESDYFFLKNSTLSGSNHSHDLGYNNSCYAYDNDYYDDYYDDCGCCIFYSNRNRFSFNFFGFNVVYDFDRRAWSLNFSFIGFLVNALVLVFLLVPMFK